MREEGGERKLAFWKLFLKILSNTFKFNDVYDKIRRKKYDRGINIKKRYSIQNIF